MKRAFKYLALAAGIAVTAISCNKDIEVSRIDEPIKLVLRAGSPETKTAITNNGDGTYSPSWSAGDALGVYFTTVEGSSAEFVNADAGSTAFFAPSAPIGVSGEQTLYAFYPRGAYNAVKEGTSIRVNVKDVQTPNAVGSFDKDADILVAKPYAGNITTINDNGGIIDLKFARVLSVVKITPTDAATAIDGEYVKSIKIEYDGSGEDAPLTGRVVLDLNSGELGEWSVKTYSASASFGDGVFALDGDNAAYLLVNPATIAADKTVTFTVKTDKHDASKSFTLANPMSFPAGNIATIALNIDDTWTIEDNTIDPNIIFKTPFYADINANTSYDAVTHGDLGVVGTSKSTITYAFEGTSQLRNNGNKISADDGSFYWCTSSTGLVIGGINTGSAQYFTLSFDRKVPQNSATLALTISEDGSHYFPITSDATVEITGTGAATSSYNFSIPAGEHTNLRLKFANSGSGATIDNVTLTKLNEAGANNKAVSFEVVKVDPTLVVTPDPVNVLVGGTQQLSVTGTNGTLHYSSNDNAVATVSESGLITAVAEGSTSIDITSDASVDYNVGATSVAVIVSASLSFETVVVSETWSADLKNTSADNNAKFVDDGQGIWTVDATYGHKAANNATAASFYSPKFDMSGVSAGNITFAHTGNVTGDSYQTLGKAYYTLDDGANWTQIELSNPASSWAWQTATISSAIYAEQIIQFRWDFQGNASKTWEVKDFTITVPSHAITVNSANSPLTVELNGDASISTTLTIASGYAWSVKSTSGQATNYTYSKDSDTQITVTPTNDNTSGSTNEGIGTMVLTDGVVDFTITFDQANKGSGGSGPAIGTVMWAETWQDGTAGEMPSAYGFEGTTVYNSGSVTYTNSGTSTKLYDDTMATTNLLLAKSANSGVWTISGIPTGGRTTLTLTFESNSNATGRYAISTTTENVSLGSLSTSGSSSPYTITATITISGTVETFNLTFTNGSSSNVRLDNLQIVTAD